MAKKVSFGAKPMEKSAAVEQWVESRAPLDTEKDAENNDNGEEVVTKRLTIDLPASLHKRVKSGCAMRGVKMADEIRRLLEEHFPGELEKGGVDAELRRYLKESSGNGKHLSAANCVERPYNGKSYYFAFLSKPLQ